MESLWHAFRPRRFGPLGAGGADVLVVGGGLAGAACAAELAAQGADVALAEAGRIGEGASGRNGGFLLTGTELDHPELARLAGEPFARMMMDLSLEAVTKVKDLQERVGRDLELDATGAFAVAASEEKAQSLRDLGSALRHAGYRAEDVPVAEAGPSLARSGYIAALRFPADAQIHPLKLLYALLERVWLSGGRIGEESPVRSFRQDGSAFAVDIGGETFSAGRIVLAVNAALPLLLPEAAGWIRPIRGQVLATAPDPRRLLNGPVYAEGSHRYFRQTRDGRLVLGGLRHLDPGTETGWEVALHRTIQDRLAAELESFAPGLSVAARWAGIMAITPDGLPVVGEVRPGLFAVAGFNGHGVALATILGRQIAQMVAGVRPPYPGLLPDRLAVAGGAPRP